MIETLRTLIPYLGAAIGALILFVLIRESIRALERRRWQKQRQKCLSQIGTLNSLKPEELLPLTLELKKLFSLPLIEGVLDEYREKNTGQNKLAEIYDQLGFIEQYLKTMQEGNSWPERAGAAEKLGEIGCPRAVLPLIALLHDAEEDREVKGVAMRALGRIHDPRAIPPLLEALHSPDPSTGQPIADVLTRFGLEAISPLMETLQSSASEGQRTWCARILGTLQAGQAVPFLLDTLSDQGEAVREAAVIALGKIHDVRAVQDLRDLLFMDPSTLVREAAAAALGQIGDDKAIESLRRALADMDSGTRLKAMEAMEVMGQKAEPIFLELLYTHESQAKTQAAVALERSGFVARLIEELSDKKLYPSSFDCLLQVAKAGVVQTMARSLNHPDFKVRLRLCEILCGSKNSRVLEALLETAQKDKEWPVRLRALEALVSLGDERAMPVILKALREEDESTRESIVEALIKMPQKNLLSAVADLISFREDKNIQIRLRVVSLLGRISSKFVIESLLSSLRDAAEEVRVVAAGALALRIREVEKQESRERVVQALIGALEDPQLAVRLAAVKSLGVFRDPTAISSLARAFEWTDEVTREDVADALAGMPVQNFFNLTDELMGLESSKARAGIAWTLGLLKDPKGLRLATFFLKDSAPLVRAAAAGAVGRYFERPQKADQRQQAVNEVLPVLISYIGDPNERVRAAVINTLGKIGDPSMIDALLPLLDHEPDLFVCQRIVLTLGSVGSGLRVISRIKQWRNADLEEESRMAGLISLILLQDPEGLIEGVRALQSEKAIGILKSFLKTLLPSVGDRFLKALSLKEDLFWKDKINPEKRTEHYVGLLKTSRSPDERTFAIQALAELGGTSAIPVIESSFSKDPSPFVRARALKSLSRFLHGPKLLEKICQAVHDPSDEIRREVVPLLCQLSPAELKETREQLLPLLDTSSLAIRKPVSELLARLFYGDWKRLADVLLGTEKKGRILGLIETIGQMGDHPATELFLKFLKHRDSDIRTLSAQYAAESRFVDVSQLLPLLEDPQERIRVGVVRGLLKYPDRSALGPLLFRLEDPSNEVRLELATGLGHKRREGGDLQIQALQRLAGDQNLAVRAQSLVSMIRLGERGLAQQARRLLAELEGHDKEVFLARLEKEGVFIELIGRLKNDQKFEVRKESLVLLASLDLIRFSSEIAGALKDPASEVRLAAVEALGQLEDPSIQQTVDALSQDPVEMVRLAVKRRKLRTMK